ncbi:TPA: hypothetical protein QH012_005357, partial [Klebsiella pneumoniae subsp. pneumoniae]|nr:hypothetical protein [Klebsiella pneumoniae subsp. pneumoniae]
KLIDGFYLERNSRNAPSVIDMFDSLIKSDESQFDADNGYVLQESNRPDNKTMTLDMASDISIQTGKSSQNNSVETDEMKNSKVGKLMVSSDFTFDFNSALKKITVKNEKLMTKLDKQDEKLQL